MYNYNAKIKRIVDGDTIDVIIDVGFKMSTTQRIRLAKIDTPETFRQQKNSEEYKKGMKAKDYVVKRLEENNNEARLQTYTNPGKYGRYLGIIWLEDSEVSLNDELIEKGLALEVEYS